MSDGISMGHSEHGRDHRMQAHGRDGAHHLPGVQRRAAQQDRPMLERHVQAGRSGLALLALWALGREVF